MLCLPTYLDQPNPGLAVSTSYTNHRQSLEKHCEKQTFRLQSTQPGELEGSTGAHSEKAFQQRHAGAVAEG